MVYEKLGCIGLIVVQPDFATGVSRVPDGPIVNALAATPGTSPDLKADPVV